MMTKNDNKTKPYTLRISEKLFDVLKAEASKNKRSIAKEIEYRLEQTLKN